MIAPRQGDSPSGRARLPPSRSETRTCLGSWNESGTGQERTMAFSRARLTGRIRPPGPWRKPRSPEPRPGRPRLAAGRAPLPRGRSRGPTPPESRLCRIWDTASP